MKEAMIFNRTLEPRSLDMAAGGGRSGCVSRSGNGASGGDAPARCASLAVLDAAVGVSGSLWEMLEFRAISQPNRLAFRFLTYGKRREETLTYGELHARAPVTAMAWHPAGEILATACDDEFLVELWEYPSGRKLSEIAGASLPVRALAWSPDGRILAMGGDDGALRLWSREQRQVMLSMDEGGRVNQLAWDSLGVRLAVVAAAGFRVLDATDGYLAEGSPLAVEPLNQRVKAEPERDLHRLRRAELLERLERWDDARRDWEALAAANPDEPRYLERGLEAETRGLKPAEAIRLLEAWSERQDRGKAAAGALARRLLQDAGTDAQFEPGPDALSGWTLLGAVRAFRGETALALAAFENGLRKT